MGSLLRSKKDKALLAKWNKKLAKAGFEDIEDQGHQDPMLKTWASSDFKRDRVRHTFEAKQNYFYAAAHFVTSNDFDSKRDRQIWTLHAEGLSVREIASKLKLGKTTVHDVVVRLRNEMQYGKPI